MKLSNIKYFCTVNGDGFRTAVFVSGCNLHCKGCFNAKAWDFEYGFELTDEVIEKILTSIEPSYISGLSILGGEPMDVKNQEGVHRIIKAFRERFGDSKDVWMWSGYYINNIPQTEYTEDIIDSLDVLVDGPFEIDKADVKLVHKGSSNQNVHYLKKK